MDLLDPYDSTEVRCHIIGWLLSEPRCYFVSALTRAFFFLKKGLVCKRKMFIPIAAGAHVFPFNSVTPSCVHSYNVGEVLRGCQRIFRQLWESELFFSRNILSDCSQLSFVAIAFLLL